MKKNETFELDSVQYLNDTYGSEAIEFIHLGGHNSNTADIQLDINGRTDYYIEAKMKSAQCGQFVLQPDYQTNTFVYTAKSAENKYTDQIKEYMNQSYDRFVTAGKKGERIDLESEIFYDWVKDYYEHKGVEFFITQDDDYIIFPTHKFDEYFDISACYRCKRSGSSHPSANNRTELTGLLDSLGQPYTLEIGKSTYVTIDYDLHKKYLQGPNYEYFCKSVAGNKYVITRCSNTWNSNVIFEIKLKNKQQPEDLQSFRESLNNTKQGQ